jgi:uncharacterized protein (TIGR02266 family)
MEVTYEKDGKYLSYFLDNVGGGGVFIETPTPFNQGVQIDLCFHLPGVVDSILARGTVMWKRDFSDDAKAGMGVKFDEIEEADRQRLEKFLSDSTGDGA